MSGDPEGPFQYRVWGYHNQRFQEDNRYDNTMTSNDPDTWTQVRRNSYHGESDTRIQGISAQLKERCHVFGILRSVDDCRPGGLASAPEDSLDRNALVPGMEDIVDTRDWVRPRLWGFKPVLPVRSSGPGCWRSLGGRHNME